jgi:crotonobetainyl-CoA:carnitine CoA-transferase CaiB-like acyl-CoA transferase
MGATVIKVEEPASGDAVRYAGTFSIGGSEGGFGYMHTRWNRGKKSVALNLRDPEGVELFKRLASKADIVIEGMRAGALDKLGLGFSSLSNCNSRIVFCSLSGLGRDGPYARMPSLGPSFDAFGGLCVVEPGQEISKWNKPQPPAIGMYGMGWPAAVGVLAALYRARTTGKGAMIEVAAADVSAQWLPEATDAALNEKASFERGGFADDKGRMVKWARMDYYRAADGHVLLVQLYHDPHWKKFLRLIHREDLEALNNHPTASNSEEQLARALTGIFATRTRDEWLDVAENYDLPFMPVNTPHDLVSNPHFLARKSTYTVRHPVVGDLRLSSTPIKTLNQEFAPALAPDLGQDTDSVLVKLLGLNAADIEDLRIRNVVR